MAESDRIQLRHLHFRSYLSAGRIRRRVEELGMELRARMAGGRPCFMVMLKGAFVFAADLIRASGLDGEVCFVRTRSYRGTESQGKVEVLLAPERSLVADHDVVLIEDIVDSGRTMHAFLPMVCELGARSVTLVTLLHKPAAAEVAVPIDLVGFEVPTLFLVGYGLDYDGLGRHLPDLYQLDQSY